MMRLVLLGVAAMLLSGCLPVGQDHLAGAARTCMVENARFVDAWACIRARYASGRVVGANPRLAGFLAEGDTLASEVQAGRIYDVDARAKLSASLVREMGE